MRTPTEKEKTYATSIGASFASMIAKFLCHPIDTVKSKIQIGRQKMENISDAKVGRALQIAIRTVKNEGIPGLFRGVTISVFGSSIAFSCYMSAYEHSKKKLLMYKYLEEHPSLAHFICGFIAEIVSCSLWLPIDIVKERLQVQSELKIYHYSGPLEALKKINISEGIIGLYRAFGATLLFFGPFSALFFVFYEKMKKIFVKTQKPTLVQSILCSSSAAGLAGFLTTPLEIVKLRMQIQRADVAMHGGSLQNSVFGYRNAFHGLYLIVTKEGIFSLYRGAVLRMFMTIPITTLSMSLTELFKQKLLQRGTLQPFI